jgi:hypothetical protein
MTLDLNEARELHRQGQLERAAGISRAALGDRALFARSEISALAARARVVDDLPK